MPVLALLLSTVALGATALPAPLDDLVASPSGALAPSGRHFTLARVRPGETVTLRARPRGRVLERLGAETEFNSPRTLFVAEHRRGWLGVPAASLPNGALGWIHDDPDKLMTFASSYWLTADLAARRVELRWGDRRVAQIPVTVGRAGSETPPGRYAVTDGLAGAGLGPFYGCCLLALTGHQPSLPPGWIGGDRIAIHGTPGSVGAAASAGCLRASDRDMVTLFKLVPLGTPVFVR
jgi:hypothetical protein